MTAKQSFRCRKHRMLRLSRDPLRMLVVFIAAVAGTSPGPSCAQARFDISSTPSCPSCRIELDRVATLGGRPDDPPLGTTPFIRRDSNGNFYAGNYLDKGAIYVFGPMGRFVKAIRPAKNGEEYLKKVRALGIDAQDTIRVFDVGANALTVISPDHEVVRSTQWSPRIMLDGYDFYGDGTAVVNAFVDTPESAGFPFHRISTEGVIEQSFGPDSFVGLTQRNLQGIRRITSGSGDGIWAAFPRRYTVELWFPNGNRPALTLVRSADWFPPYSPREPLTPAEMPAPSLAAIQTDADGRIWTLSIVGDPRWSESLRVVKGEQGDVYVPREHSLVYDSVLEVIDPQCACLVASQRFDLNVAGFIDREHIYSWRPTADDHRYEIDIWQLHVIQHHN